MAIIVHSALNIVALLLAGKIAWQAGRLEWLIVQLACTGMLWRYSTSWKRQFMIGNVVVALLTAFTIGVLIIYDPAVRQAWIARPPGAPDPDSLWILLSFMFFAFALTWMREIVKDMEDYKGDDAEGCITMPIKWGLLKSTRFVQALGFLVLALLAIAICLLWAMSEGFSISALFMAGALIIPLLFWINRLPKAASTAHYHQASTRLKWIMVSGIVSLLVLHATNYG
jgi:4-hydroxybenzoate polyprenyltransferase